MKSHAKKSNSNKGFTLVEVAIVIIIGGIILTGLTRFITQQMRHTQIKVTETRIQEIDSAIQNFFSLNGRYPCASPRNAALDAPEFGREVDCAGPVSAAESAQAHFTPTGGSAGPDIRIGSVPVRELNLPDEYIMDAWSNRFTYAVTEDLTDSSAFSANGGGINVIDSAGNNAMSEEGKAHYVIISHGQTGMGATPLNGGTSFCTTTTNDQENCNDLNATFRRTTIKSTANNAFFFDDFVHAQLGTSSFLTGWLNGAIPPAAVVAFDLAACPDGWTGYAPAVEKYIVGKDSGSPNPKYAPATQVAGTNNPYVPLLYCRKN